MDRISEIFERWENQLEMPEYEEIWFMFEQIKQISAERDLLVLNDIPYLVETIKKVSAERDAAIADLKQTQVFANSCAFCVHNRSLEFCPNSPKGDGNKENCWEYRSLPDSTAEGK